MVDLGQWQEDRFQSWNWQVNEAERADGEDTS